MAEESVRTPPTRRFYIKRGPAKRSAFPVNKRRVFASYKPTLGKSAAAVARKPARKRRRCAPKKSSKVQRAEFEGKYVQEDELGVGGCGAVYAGYRREDNLQVAIKHIPKCNALTKALDETGKRIPLEVAVMLKLQSRSPEPARTASPVTLLDWYDLHKELVLVLERPILAVDMFTYVRNCGGSLDEEKAKIIMKQLIKMAIDLEDSNVFHRDIKLKNILIETDSEVPQARLIDFGLSCFTKKRSFYKVFSGTPNHTPPEWICCFVYRPGPTTVWQLGVVLYETLHQHQRFNTGSFVMEEISISEELSSHCQDFLRSCLSLYPERRPKLRELLDHPWFE